MENYIIKNCSGCDQPLRIPGNIGGMLMRCPNCGYEFYTDFKLAVARKGGEDKKPVRKKTVRPPGNFRIVV